MKAPWTLLRRPAALVAWHLSTGPTQLAAARLRRKGDIAGALVRIAGPSALIEAIRSMPDPAERQRQLRAILRWASSPRRRRAPRRRPS